MGKMKKNELKNIILFRINSLLNSLAILTQSSTVDDLRIRYGNWYNLQIMRKLIECDYYLKNKHIVISLEVMETLGHIVIANIFYLGLTSAELSEYLNNSLSVVMPETLPNIQISAIDVNHAKIVFPL